MPCRHEADNVHQAIPVNLHRPDGDGNRIDLRILQPRFAAPSDLIWINRQDPVLGYMVGT